MLLATPTWKHRETTSSTRNLDGDKWTDKNWKESAPAWCAVERSPEQGARRRRVKNDMSIIRAFNIQGLDMDPAWRRLLGAQTGVVARRAGAEHPGGARSHRRWRRGCERAWRAVVHQLCSDRVASPRESRLCGLCRMMWRRVKTSGRAPAGRARRGSPRCSMSRCGVEIGRWPSGVVRHMAGQPLGHRVVGYRLPAWRN